MNNTSLKCVNWFRCFKDGPMDVLVGWSLTSLVSTDTAISETMGLWTFECNGRA